MKICKLKIHWNIISHLSDGKNPNVDINILSYYVAKAVEKVILSYVSDGRYAY